MKIKINQDLLESTCLSKNGININKTISHSFIKGLMWATPAAGLIEVEGEHKLLLLTILGAAYALYPLINILYQSLFKKECQEEFGKELNSVASKLKNLRVHTNKELLEQASIVKKDYKLVLDNNSIPHIKENKYIAIPTDNDSTIELLQEHNIGSKDYELSVSGRTKQKKLELSKQKI